MSLKEDALQEGFLENWEDMEEHESVDSQHDKYKLAIPLVDPIIANHL